MFVRLTLDILKSTLGLIEDCYLSKRASVNAFALLKIEITSCSMLYAKCKLLLSLWSSKLYFVIII